MSSHVPQEATWLKYPSWKVTLLRTLILKPRVIPLHHLPLLETRQIRIRWAPQILALARTCTKARIAILATVLLHQSANPVLLLRARG